MCGIAGFTHFGGRPPEALATLVAMCRAIAHRGPDGQGVFQDQAVSLGHRRLAIIDLATGDQPMANEDGAVQVVFNGEIYNFQALRRELETLGHVFASHSDTEVLVHGYESWGEGLFAKIDGMFALALYDAPGRRLLLARDRMGKKPLHYLARGDDLAFASEIKALLCHPWLGRRRELDTQSLAYYLALEYVPTPRSLFRGVRKLPPGCFLVLDARGLRQERYWSLEQASRPDQPGLDFDEAASHFWGLLEQAARRRLVSDVPLGVFLSGGLDSYAVALACAASAGQRLKTFSIGFREPSFDESAAASLAARALGSEHQGEVLGMDQCLRVLPAVLEGLDEPMADASILPTYLLSQFTRRQVTVALSGDGADEFLAGYPTFQAHRLAADLGPGLGRVAHGLHRLAARLPVSHRQLTVAFRLQWFLRSLGRPAGERLLGWLGAFNAGERAALLTPEVLGGLECPEGLRAEVAGRRDFRDLRGLSLLYARTYLENDILVKVDRASMLNSLEVRCPFLDTRVVGFLAGLPDSYKLRRPYGGKALLKRALRGRIPEPLLKRPKQGFGVPISAWLAGPLREWAEDLLSPRRLRDQGLFQPAQVQRLWRDHLARRRDNRKFLWTLLMFQAWRDNFLDCPSPSAAAA